MLIKYRPEIDGLRTIAVLAVLIYHAHFLVGDEVLLKGGFFGVDVFFVISGFLITSIIMKELQASGKFSFLNFYERRARRILPALFLVILVALPFAWHLLLPSQMIDFGKSILSTLLFGSNFYWYDSLQQYGAESALLKPFLHTWSLAVEEQYYIIFPIILLVIYKWFRSYTILLLTAGLLMSLGLSDFITSKSQSISFYMLPTRFWELLAGSLLANILYFYPQKENDALLNKTMPILGLYLIGYALFFVEFESHHPGYITLLPVLGTILIIWFANEKDLVTKVLSSHFFVTTGLVSYSLYLWHYPIFAFGRIINPSPSFIEKIIWIALTIVLSILGYYLVEKPFRNRNHISLKVFGLVILLTLTFIVSVSVFFMKKHQITPRVERLQPFYGENEVDNKVLGRRSWDLLERIHSMFGYESKRNVTANKASASEKKNLWFLGEETTKILIVGNSHSKDIFNALELNKEMFPGMEFARYGIKTNASVDEINLMKEAPNFKSADVILISSRFGRGETLRRLNRANLTGLPKFIQEIKKEGKLVVLASNAQEFKPYLGYENIFDGYVRSSKGMFDAAELKSLYYSLKLEVVDDVNLKLSEIASANNITYLDRYSIICSDDTKTCDGLTSEGLKALYDYGHYTLDGAKYFGRKMAEQGLLNDLEYKEPN